MGMGTTIGHVKFLSSFIFVTLTKLQKKYFKFHVKFTEHTQLHMKSMWYMMT